MPIPRPSAMLLLTAALLAPAALLSAPPCTFRTPEGWSAARTRWVGDCVEGRADGLGILKEMDGSSITRVFYGRLKQGDLVIGVIETSEGQSAGGRFENGRLVPPASSLTDPLATPEALKEARLELIRAYDDASKAAWSTAHRYREEGNEASAEYYEAVSQRLAEQIE